MSAENYGYVLMAAVRYQLPRFTYGSGIVADAVVAAAPTMDANMREVIARDIVEWLAKGRAHECDRTEWRRALTALEEASK